jgi:predicted HNH restriction endonuclease
MKNSMSSAPENDFVDRNEWNPDDLTSRKEYEDSKALEIKLKNDEDDESETVQEITGYEITIPEVFKPEIDPPKYPDNWDDISREIKNARVWRCELCKFTSIGSSAIHAHHINKDKSDNVSANLQVLCARCHGTKHGSGDGMGEYMSKTDREELEAWHRNTHDREIERALQNKKMPY